MDSKYTYSMIPLSSNISSIFDIEKYYTFSYFLKYGGNILKIDHNSLFQTSSCIAKQKQKLLED